MCPVGRKSRMSQAAGMTDCISNSPSLPTYSTLTKALTSRASSPALPFCCCCCAHLIETKTRGPRAEHRFRWARRAAHTRRGYSCYIYGMQTRGADRAGAQWVWFLARLAMPLPATRVVQRPPKAIARGRALSDARNRQIMVQSPQRGPRVVQP